MGAATEQLEQHLSERHRLRLLYAIGTFLEQNEGNHTDLLARVLDILVRGLSLARGTVSVFERLNGRLRVEAYCGLTERQATSLSGGVGGKLNERALDTGQTIVIPLGAAGAGGRRRVRFLHLRAGSPRG
ncbi:MAG: hypothetical protein M5R36_09505 [Deltaproteobacteria bacterium]|nr:hypothetical protein [Deltaproteobacteria bacterium]